MKSLKEMRAEMEEQDVETEMLGSPMPACMIPPITPMKTEPIKKKGDTVLGLLQSSMEMFDNLVTKEFRCTWDEQWEVLDLQVRIDQLLTKIRKGKAGK